MAGHFLLAIHADGKRSLLVDSDGLDSVDDVDLAMATDDSGEVVRLAYNHMAVAEAHVVLVCLVKPGIQYQLSQTIELDEAHRGIPSARLHRGAWYGIVVTRAKPAAAAGAAASALPEQFHGFFKWDGEMLLKCTSMRQTPPPEAVRSSGG
jgi:hypothetical protein